MSVEHLSQLEQLKKMLAWKKSRSFYADKLEITERELDELMEEIRGNREKPENQLDIDFEGGEIKKVNKEKGTLESTVVCSFEPKNDKELAELHKVDLTRYKISSYWTKQRGDKFTSSLLCNLLKPNEFSQDRWEKFLKGYKSDYKQPKVSKFNTGGEEVDVEISLADFHLDKLTLTMETVGQRKEEYIRVLINLLGSVVAYNVEKIVFVVGNDLFHTDTFQGTTTNGTPLDISTSWFNAYEQGFDLMVRAISLIRKCAEKVEVILVQGNHSRTKEYYLAHALEIYFKSDKEISFQREATNLKHTLLGNTFVGYHHGNCKMDELPLIFATASKSSIEWGFAPYREIHTGDKHYYLVKEIKGSGVRVQQIPSLSGDDRWHDDNNFINHIKAGLALVYSPTKGKVAEFEERIPVVLPTLSEEEVHVN